METEPKRLQVAVFPIGLIQHKGECSGDSRDLIHEHKVGTGTVMTALPDMARGANQSRPHQLVGSMA
jgi:hypothetical protein